MIEQDMNNVQFPELKHMPGSPFYKKPRWRWVWDKSFMAGGFWSPQNYEAETIFLINVYGHTNIARRYK